MKKYRILYFGTWGYGAAGLDGLLQCKSVHIVKVYTKWDVSSENEYLNKVYEICIKNGLEVFNSDRNRCDKKKFIEDVLSNKDIDFIISCSFDRIFGYQILELPKILPLNIHPSLLPKYRGVKPLENAIVNGETETGVTLHILTKELDAGDIILQSEVINIYDDMTYKNLYDLQCIEIKKLLIKFFNNVDCYIVNRKAQNNENASFAPRLQLQFDDHNTVSELRNEYAKNKEN